MATASKLGPIDPANAPHPPKKGLKKIRILVYPP